MSSGDLTIYNLVLENVLLVFYSLISSGEDSLFVHFAAATANHYNFGFLHSTRYPSLLGRQRKYGMRSLPNTSTHDQQWEWNPQTFWSLVQRPIH